MICTKNGLRLPDQARDALFELTDAVILTLAANSFAEFSLSPLQMAGIADNKRWQIEAVGQQVIDLCTYLYRMGIGMPF